jgi:hypothetical protein
MPMQKTTSPLLAKMGSKLLESHKKHKTDEPAYGNAGLPEGIENGVAKLVLMQVGEFKEGENKGQPFFMAQAVVVHPIEHNGIKVEGARTSIGPEPLCDTPKATGSRKTFDDHYALYLNHLRILGVDTNALGEKPEEIDANLQTAMNELVAMGTTGKLYTKFRTWKGKKQTTGPFKDREPRVVHEWNGACEWNGHVDPTAATSDSTPAGPGNDNPNTGADADGALSELAAKADAGDQDAIPLFCEMALQMGATEEMIAAQTTYSDVVALLLGGEPATAPEAPAGPAKGSAVKYRLIDPKTKKPFTIYDKATKKMVPKEPVECIVESVDAAAKTVVLKNAKDGKSLYSGVAWDSLVS